MGREGKIVPHARESYPTARKNRRIALSSLSRLLFGKKSKPEANQKTTAPISPDQKKDILFKLGRDAIDYLMKATTAPTTGSTANVQKALSLANEGLELDPLNGQMLSIKITSLARLGKTQEALKICDLAIAAHPRSAFTEEKQMVLSGRYKL
jgi:hypothetical protein